MSNFQTLTTHTNNENAKKQKVYIKTFGCRTNIVDSEIMLTQIKNTNKGINYDITLDDTKADIIIVNSCTVTNNADYKTRAYISSIKKQNNKAKILFTGCGVKSQAKKLYDEHKIHTVFESSNKENIKKILQNTNLNRKYIKGTFDNTDKVIINSYQNKTKAFVKIQEGCNFACSYCIIPSVRGHSRSFEVDYILKQVRTLAQNGHQEFVLTGTNIGSYSKSQKNNKTSLAGLCKQIFKIDGVKRLRLSSIEPTQIDDEFFEILKENQLAKYLHIALQHSDKKMLKIMKRRNKVDKDLELFNKLSEYGFALGSDFIVGHPYESEIIFENAFNMLKKFPLTHLHIFPFSKRANTPSALMKEQVDKKTANIRAKIIRELIESKNYNFRKQLKQNKKSINILVENLKNGFYSGYDEYFNLAKTKQEKHNFKLDLKGKWINTKKFDVKQGFNEII
jgi:MiaB-like tRNA modifying enzyme